MKIVAAKSPELVAVRDGNTFFSRRLGVAVDQPIPWEGDSPDMMTAALLAKWDFLPVVGLAGESEPEIGDGQFCELAEDKDANGDTIFRVTGFKSNT